MLIYLFNLRDVNADDKFISIFESTFIILLQCVKNLIAVANHSSKLSDLLSGSSVTYKILQYILTNFYP